MEDKNEAAETRAQCATCGGDGKIKDGSMDCPDCNGTGEQQNAEAVEDVETREPIAKRTIEARKARAPRRGERETRTIPIEELAIEESRSRAFDAKDSEGRPLLRFSGYASVFDKRYPVGPYEETIASGAFKRSLANPNLDTVLRVEHEDLPIARTTGSVKLADGTEQRTLTLTEDGTGLRVEALLDPEDPDVQRLVPKFRRGDLKEMSFAFRCNDDQWNDDYSHRTIRSAEIHRGDVAIVTYGASPSTYSTMRSEQAVEDIRKFGFERFLEMMVEWRDFTLTSVEDRAGKMISSTNGDFLSQMLDLFASADEAVDEGQARMADFLGVPNPNVAADDESEAEADADDTSSERSAEVIQLPTPRDSEFLLELRRLQGGKR